MLLYPAMKDLLKNVSSRYLLVNVVANRARTIAREAERAEESLNDKPVTLAIREVAGGVINMDTIQAMDGEDTEETGETGETVETEADEETVLEY